LHTIANHVDNFRPFRPKIPHWSGSSTQIVHQGQWAAPCRCLNPWPSGRIDRFGVRNSPTQNSNRCSAQLKVGIITDHNGRLAPAGTGAIRGTVLAPSGLPEANFVTVLRLVPSAAMKLIPVSGGRDSYLRPLGSSCPSSSV
jgi:hypothetical protein